MRVPLPAAALAALLASAAPALAAGWSAPAALPGVPVTASPAVTIAPGGAASAVAVRPGSRPRVIELARRRTHRARWTRGIRVTTRTAGRLVTPRVAVDRRGGALAAWSDARGVWVASRRARFASWGRPVLVSGLDRPVAGAGWSAALSRGGVATVAWHSREGVRLAVRPRGGRFTAPMDAGDVRGRPKAAPDVAATSRGNALVVWESADSASIESAWLTRGDSEPVALPSIEARVSDPPRLAVDAVGGAQIAYGRYDLDPAADASDDALDEAPIELVLRRLGRGAPEWSGPIRLAESTRSDGDLYVTLAGLAVNPRGDATALLFHDDDTPGDSVLVEVEQVARGAGSVLRGGGRELGFVYESDAVVVSAGSVAVVGWYEQGEPGITTAPRQRDTRVGVAGRAVLTPKRIRSLGGSRSELRGLHGSPSGAAAVLREPRRLRVATYRP